MDNDLKIDIFQHVVNSAEKTERESIKKTICIIFAKKYANCMKETHFYTSDFMGEGEDLFQMDYNIEYANGEFKKGNCIIDTKEVVAALGFTDYEELKNYLAGKYKDDEKAWNKIIDEMQTKGLSPTVDESEGGENFITNIL